MIIELAIQTHLVVDTHSGLKIVLNNHRNFFSGNYAVQFIGTHEECKEELKRLKSLDYGE